MASEVGRFISQQVTDDTKGAQHPTFAQLEGDGDTIIIEGRKAAFRLGGEPQSPAERQQAARMQYEQAFALLQNGKAQDEALERLNKSLEYDPTFGDAYVLKSYVRLEVIPDLEEALKAGKLAVQYAPNNPDSHYTLGLIYEKRGQYAEAEGAMRRALAANPSYVDVYFTLGSLYADHLKDQKKAVEAFERYLELGGTHNRAREVVAQSRATDSAASLQNPLILCASLEIAQADFQGSSGDFRPADLRIFGEHGGRFRILYVEIQYLDDAVVDLHVSHKKSSFKDEHTHRKRRSR